MDNIWLIGVILNEYRINTFRNLKNQIPRTPDEIPDLILENLIDMAEIKENKKPGKYVEGRGAWCKKGYEIGYGNL